MRTHCRASPTGCLLSTSVGMVPVGLSARATCGPPSPPDPPSDGCPPIREPYDS